MRTHGIPIKNAGNADTSISLVSTAILDNTRIPTGPPFADLSAAVHSILLGVDAMGVKRDGGPPEVLPVDFLHLTPFKCGASYTSKERQPEDW
jgi:hypothetical protein